MRRLLRLPYLPLWLAPLLLLAPVLFTGRAVFWGTPALQFHPWRVFAWDALKAGQLPLWNPLSGMGAPLIANYQSALFYPPNWLYFGLAALGGEAAMAWGMALLVWFHLALAGIGMAKLARELGLGVLAQTISGLAFGMSGYLVARSHFLSINAALAWLPWVLWGVLVGNRESRVERRESGIPNTQLPNTQLPNTQLPNYPIPNYLLPLHPSLIPLTLLFLAGHAQTAWYTLLLAGMWVIIVSWGSGVASRKSGTPNTQYPIPNTPSFDYERSSPALRSGRNTQYPIPLIRFAFAVLIAAALSALQLLPTAELLLQSQRAAGADYDFVMTYSFWPWRFLGLIAPGLFGSPVTGDYWGYANYWEDAVYIGLLPFLLALAALRNRRSRIGHRESRISNPSTSLRASTHPSTSGSLRSPSAQDAIPNSQLTVHNSPFTTPTPHPSTTSEWSSSELCPPSAQDAIPQFPNYPITQFPNSPITTPPPPLHYSRLTIPLLALTLLSFLLALGRNTPVFPFLYRYVPSFDLFQAPARYSIWAVFALSLLAGIGAQSWRRPAGVRARGRVMRWVVVAVGVVLAALAVRLVVPGITPSFVRATALAGALGVAAGVLWLFAPLAHSQFSTGNFQPSPWHYAVIIFVALDLLIAGWGLNPGISLDFYRGKAPTAPRVRRMLGAGRLYLPDPDEYTLTFDRYFRFDTFQGDWETLRASLLPNLTLLDRLPSANNFDPLLPGRYARWTETLEQADRATRDWMLAQMSVAVLETRDPESPTGVRFQPIKNLPRLQWYLCARPVAGPQAAWDQVMARVPDKENVLILEGLAGADADRICGHQDTSGTAELLSETPNELRIRVEAGSPGWLLVRDTYYPGWRARVDGRPVPLYPANYLFRGVPVPAGVSEIALQYRPFSFYLGAVVSLVSLVGLVGLKVAGRKYRES